MASDYNQNINLWFSIPYCCKNIQLIVYYEVPIGQRDEVKSKFVNSIQNQTVLQQRN